MPEGDSARPARPDSPASEPAGFGREAASESLIGQAAAAATVAVIAAAAIAAAPRLRRFFRLPRPRPHNATSAGNSSQRPRAATRPCGLAILLDVSAKSSSIPSHRCDRPGASRRPQRNALNQGPHKKGVRQASRDQCGKVWKIDDESRCFGGPCAGGDGWPFLGSGPAIAAGAAPGVAGVGVVRGAARAVIPASRAVTTASAAKAASMAAVPGSQVCVTRYDGQGNGGQATAMALSPDGGTVFVAGLGGSLTSGLDFATVAYDAVTGTQLWVGSYNGPASKDDVIHAVGISPDGKTVFVTGASMGSSPAVNGYLTVAYNAATGAQTVGQALHRTPEGRR